MKHRSPRWTVQECYTNVYMLHAKCRNKLCPCNFEVFPTTLILYQWAASELMRTTKGSPNEATCNDGCACRVTTYKTCRHLNARMLTFKSEICKKTPQEYLKGQRARRAGVNHASVFVVRPHGQRWQHCGRRGRFTFSFLHVGISESCTATTTTAFLKPKKACQFMGGCVVDAG